MSNRLFNTPFEFSLHVLMLLSETEHPMTIDNITALDFMATHAITACETDSQEMSGFTFSELAARRSIMYKAVRNLVLDGQIVVQDTENGIFYSITDSGSITAGKLTTEYSVLYRNALKNIWNTHRGTDDVNLMNRLVSQSVEALGR